MITDPLFYAVAIPAVIFVGLAKGGFVSALAMLGVPLITLVISPVQAAAILLGDQREEEERPERRLKLSHGRVHRCTGL